MTTDAALWWMLLVISQIITTVLGKYNTVGSDPEASSLGMNTELGLAILQDYVIPVDGYIHYTTLHLRNAKTANIQIWRPTLQAGEMQFVDEIVLHPPTTVPAEGTIRTLNVYDDNATRCFRVNKDDRLAVFIRSIPSSMTFVFDTRINTDRLSHYFTRPEDYPTAGTLTKFDVLSPYWFKFNVDIYQGTEVVNTQTKLTEYILPDCQEWLLDAVDTKTTENPIDFVTQDLRGPTGPVGEPGAKGEKGDQGVTGTSGSDGSQGVKGQKGDLGDTGSVGSDGPRGNTGSDGVKGEAGDKGESGPEGLKGDIGPLGPEGDTGETGADGPAGQKGSDGATGARGQKGDDGTPGVLGQDGQKGAKGEPADTAGRKGEPGINGITGPVGEKGDKGDIGLTGDDGRDGKKGDTGIKGDVGPPGISGAETPQAAESSSSDSSINGEPIIIVLIVWNILLTVSFIIGCVFFIRRTSHRLNGTAPDSNAEPRNLRSVPGSSHGYVVRRNFGSYPSNHHIFWDENGEDVTKPSHTEA